MKKRKIISIILIIIQLCTILTNLSIVKASIKEGDVVLLQGDHECDSLVEYWMTSHNKWSYKIVWYVYYIDAQTGNRYPAFCVEPAKEGVGTGYSSYNTTISKEVDPVIWRILSKGYMGSKWQDWNTPGQLDKIECDDDFYSATKIAIHSYKTGNAPGASPKSIYKIGDRSVDGNTVEEIQRRARKALDIAQRLYEYGINGKETYEGPQVYIATNGERKIEKINGEEYYVQNYKVTANKSLKSYNVSIENFVSGAKILDSNNKENSSFTGNSFKIAIPTKNIKGAINGKINIRDAEIKTYPIYYAQSSIPEAQSYVTYTSGYEKAGTSINMQVDPNNSSLALTKIDSETKKPLPNVTFEISKENGEKIGEYTTNEKGVIELNKLSPGIIKIKEIKVDDKYILNGEEEQVLLQWGKTSKIEIENNRKKGNLKIVKVDSENEEIKLEGVEFEVYNDKKELINKVTTNENGEATIKNLNIGTYIIKETKTNEQYILNENEIEVKIEWNKETEIKLENSMKKGNLKIVKVDSENEEIKIQGVEFELYDIEENYINTFITNENGEIIVENLDIGNYIIREVKTNEEYVLNDEKIEIQIEGNKETKVEIKNERIKGKIKIIKTSEDDNKITGQKAGTPIQNVKFEVKNDKGEIVETLITNEEGIAITNNLEKGKYTIKEIETTEQYELNEIEYEIEIKKHEEIIELKITNKSKNKLPRTGF